MVGTIKTKAVSVITFDNDGAPIQSGSSFGSEVPCRYISASKNDVVNIGDGSFTQASYIITVKDMGFDSKQIELIDSRGNKVCEKDVKSLEVLESIKRVKIIV